MKYVIALGTSIALVVCGTSQTPGTADDARDRPRGAYRVLDDDVALIESLTHAGASGRTARGATLPLAGKAAQVAPCASLSFGEVFCLGLGYRDALPRYHQLLHSPAGQPTGSMTFRAWVKQRWAQPERARTRGQVDDAGDIRASLDKALAIRVFLDSVDNGTPLSTMDSLAAQQENQSESTALAPPPEGDFRYIMSGHASKQVQSNWCGPAAFQMIEWADDDTKQTQEFWAGELGTTAAGTALSNIVSLVNSRTTWDIAAGDYIVQGIGTWGTDRFFEAHRAHIGDGTPAPVIEHPLLHRTYFPYLEHDGNGHFQVGRGYSDPADPDKNRTIGIFEPWNEADWYDNGNVTWGAQNVVNLKLLQATKENSSFKNIGL